MFLFCLVVSILCSSLLFVLTVFMHISNSCRLEQAAPILQMQSLLWLVQYHLFLGISWSPKLMTSLRRFKLSWPNKTISPSFIKVLLFLFLRDNWSRYSERKRLRNSSRKFWRYFVYSNWLPICSNQILHFAKFLTKNASVSEVGSSTKYPREHELMIASHRIVFTHFFVRKTCLF